MNCSSPSSALLLLLFPDIPLFHPYLVAALPSLAFPWPLSSMSNPTGAHNAAPVVNRGRSNTSYFTTSTRPKRRTLDESTGSLQSLQETPVELYERSGHSRPGSLERGAQQRTRTQSSVTKGNSSSHSPSRHSRSAQRYSTNPPVPTSQIHSDALQRSLLPTLYTDSGANVRQHSPATAERLYNEHKDAAQSFLTFKKTLPSQRQPSPGRIPGDLGLLRSSR